MACAWDSPDSPTASGVLFVLVVLADHAGDHSGEDWTAWPSVERICRRTGLHRATVQRHLETLVDLGWITRKRRVRPDGTLGVYDYTLHRHADVRGDLRLVRAREKALAETEVCEVEVAAVHVAKCDMEPCRNLASSMSHFVADPCRNLRPQEPLEEPLEEPSQDAREPGGQGFAEGFAAYPESGRKRTNLGEAQAGWALAAGEVGGDEMVSRVRRYSAEDPTLKTGDHGAPGFHRWLSEGRWRQWEREPVGAALTGGAISVPFLGPGELRAALIAAGIAANDVGRCGWIAPNGLRPATGYVFDKIRREAGHVLRRHAIDLIQPFRGNS